jgi:hypothetical protein
MDTSDNYSTFMKKERGLRMNLAYVDRSIWRRRQNIRRYSRFFDANKRVERNAQHNEYKAQ